MVETVKSKRTNGKHGWADLPVIEGFSHDESLKFSQYQAWFAAKYDVLSESLFPTAWLDIQRVFDEFKIEFDHRKPYSLNGKKCSVQEFLLMEAQKRRSTKLHATAVLIDTIFFIENQAGNGCDVSDYLDKFYGCSYRLALSMAEDAITAGGSRTGKATKAKADRKDENKQKALALYERLKVTHPEKAKSKKWVAKQIYKEVGRSENTVYKYLTE